jgi:SNF2 family DNA or RNA helicase
LGDDLGLGKTVSAILGMFNKGGLPAVVVCQAHLTEHWEYQIAKCTRLTTHVVKTRTPYKLPKDIDVYIFTYSKTIGWVDLYSSGFFRYAIFDEVQELRTGYVSQKYCACKKLSDAAKYALGLSATPIYIDASNIYNILHLLKSHCMGSFEDFCREWAGASYRTVIQDTKALGSYLRDSFLFLRRTREDVGMEMPKVNVVPHLIEYDEKAVEAEEELLHQLAITITTGNFMERGQASRDFDLRMRQITGVSKAKYVANYVKIILDSGEPVLLFGWHREVYEIWEKEFAAYNPCFYTGTESPSKKNASKADFIEGRTNLMIMSLRSGIGVDGLQKRCSWVVFGELDWSPQVHKQDIGRIDRDGQEHPVTAVYLVSNGGSDPVLVDLLGVRASLSHNIIDPFSAVPEQHSDDSRIRMMAEHVLNKHKKRKEDLKAVDKIIADIPDEEIQND